jgi:hypothetical protein
MGKQKDTFCPLEPPHAKLMMNCSLLAFSLHKTENRIRNLTSDFGMAVHSLYEIFDGHKRFFSSRQHLDFDCLLSRLVASYYDQSRSPHLLNSLEYPA